MLNHDRNAPLACWVSSSWWAARNCPNWEAAWEKESANLRKQLAATKPEEEQKQIKEGETKSADTKPGEPK